MLQYFQEGGIQMKLDLYKKDSCPFCQRVLQYLDESGRTDIIFHDTVMDNEAAEELTEAGGKLQVPCLLIDGKPMYESLDIIEWLQAHPQEG